MESSSTLGWLDSIWLDGQGNPRDGSKIGACKYCLRGLISMMLSLEYVQKGTRPSCLNYALSRYLLTPHIMQMKFAKAV